MCRTDETEEVFVLEVVDYNTSDHPDNYQRLLNLVHKRFESRKSVRHVHPNEYGDDHDGDKLEDVPDWDSETTSRVVREENFSQGIPPEEESEGTQHCGKDHEGHRQTDVTVPKFSEVGGRSVAGRSAEEEDAETREVHHTAALQVESKHKLADDE